MKSPETLRMERMIHFYRGEARRLVDKGFCHFISYEIGECSFEESSLTIYYPTERWMMNPAGVLHGGMTAAFFDITCGTLSMAIAEVYNPTIQLNVTYLLPIPCDDRLRVTAVAQRVGRTISSLFAQGWSEKTGKLCATATALFYVGGEDRVQVPDSFVYPNEV